MGAVLVHVRGPMEVLSVTGGIACGKTAVARAFPRPRRARGRRDVVARDVVAVGTRDGLDAVVAAFGSDVLAPDGSLDRKRLGQRVFGDDVARRALNAILHPRIGAESMARLAALMPLGHGFALYDAALLVENGTHANFAGLIVVTARPEVQRARLTGARRHHRGRGPGTHRRAVAPRAQGGRGHARDRQLGHPGSPRGPRPRGVRRARGGLRPARARRRERYAIVSEGITLVTGFPRLVAKLIVRELLVAAEGPVALLVRGHYLDDARRFVESLDAGDRVTLVEGDVTSIDLGLTGASTSRSRGASRGSITPRRAPPRGPRWRGCARSTCKAPTR